MVTSYGRPLDPYASASAPPDEDDDESYYGEEEELILARDDEWTVATTADSDQHARSRTQEDEVHLRFGLWLVGAVLGTVLLPFPFGVMVAAYAAFQVVKFVAKSVMHALAWICDSPRNILWILLLFLIPKRVVLLLALLAAQPYIQEQPWVQRCMQKFGVTRR
ncbi:hypothetical protein AAVH_19872 [Aphelenchoides avenae]|nr:hypothetical protein AAVH_19872 [Aphelenchus avenae]